MSDFFRRLFAPERRWLLITVLVGIGAIIVFNLLPRGAGGNTRGGAAVPSGPSEQLQAAQLQAQVQLAQSQQAAQVAISQQAGEFAARELEAQIALAMGEQRADVELAAISGELAAIRDQTNAQLSMAALQTELGLAEIESEEAREIALISSQEAMFEMQAQSQLAQQALFAELQAQQSADETARFLGMFEAQRDIAIYEGAYALEAERIEAETERLGIRTQGRNQDRQSSRGFWGSVIGAGASLLGGFLSDYRLKEDIKWIGKREDGIDVYSWRYQGGTMECAGPMAQDVAQVYPHMVGETPSGALYLKEGFA